MTRATAAILVALVSTLILPTSVLAARPERASDVSTQVWCGDLESEAGSAYVYAWVSDTGETFADLGFWAVPAQPGEDPVTWAGWSTEALMSVDESTLGITFGLYVLGDEETSEPPFVGEATFSATLAPSGEPETYRSNDQYGNHHSRSSGSVQRYDVDGSLSLPDGITFDLGGCEILRVAQRWFGTNPAHSVWHSTELGLSCAWETASGYVALFAWDQEFGAGASLWIATDDAFLVGSAPARLTTSTFESTFDLYSGWDGEVHVGTAAAAAELANIGRISDTQVFGDSRYTFKGARLGVSGSLDIDAGGLTATLAMDDASCQASDIRIAELPARHQRVLPVENDTPDSALQLKVGDKLLVSTAGTDAAPEAACILDDGEGGAFDGPITNTAWWRVEGTGGSLTIDTAGSSFDTMMAVYLVDGASVGEQVGCVDDVHDSLQARITFDAAADASYFVQIGGYGGQTGDLVIVVSE